MPVLMRMPFKPGQEVFVWLRTPRVGWYYARVVNQIQDDVFVEADVLRGYIKRDVSLVRSLEEHTQMLLSS